MKNYSFLIIIVFIVFSISSCSDKTEKKGDKLFKVFEDELVNFNPDGTDTTYVPNDKGIVRITSGRILLKKINIPKYDRSVEIKAKIKLYSNGDRWDKSGSCFILSKDSKVNLLNVQKGETEFPTIADTAENFAGIVQDEDYKPPIELIRFMTPFGVGAYSDSLKSRKPVYIPFYEKEVVWENDITELASELSGEVWVGIWIDTWTKEGYKISLDIEFNESDLPCDKISATNVQPILNTIYYIGPQRHVDVFARKDLDIDFEIPENAKNVRLKYITTGHGGHEGGDEFVKKNNVISVDGKEVLNFIPWRDDCASFRRFNPSSGVWLIKDTAQYIDWEAMKYKEKVIEERIASSDYSRSNWCPGSDVLPVEIMLDDIKAGKHKLTVSIPEAQEIDGDKINHWLISAYLVWDEE